MTDPNGSRPTPGGAGLSTLGRAIVRVAAVLLAAGAHVPARAGFVAPTATDASRASAAYADLIARFWIGSPTGGHFTRYPTQPPSAGAPVETVLCKGCLWEYAMGVQVLYAEWKVTGSADADARLVAMWSWIRANWSLGDVSQCGPGFVSTAQDDAAWGAAMFVGPLYEASGDATALTYSKAVMDCATTQWADADGGYFYDVTKSNKTSYMAPLAWAMLDYAVKAGDASYQAKAVAIDAFAATNLTQGRPADGLYWVNVDGATYADLDGGNPYRIVKGSSVVMLAGDMGFAALDARLYAITGSASYRARALATAAGLFAFERIGAVFLNARDPNVDGWAAYPYATWVVPLLPSSGTADGSTILATARAVGALARGSDGTYAPDWDGATSVLATAGPGYNLKVSANAAIWPIVGQTFGH